MFMNFQKKTTISFIPCHVQHFSVKYLFSILKCK